MTRTEEARRPSIATSRFEARAREKERKTEGRSLKEAGHSKRERWFGTVMMEEMRIVLYQAT